MRKARKVRLCLPLAVFGLVGTITLSTAGQQAAGTQSVDSQQPAEQKAAQQQAPEPQGQQPPVNPSGQGEAKPQEREKKPQENQPQSGTSKDRLFFLMPNFLTLENASQVPPLTTGQKFNVVARSTFDPFQFTYYFILAGISQGANSEGGFGQGAQGYGKRFGAIFADTTIENFMVGAVFPSLLRQDPRYFQKGKGGFGRRTWYALTRIVVTRGDSGNTQFNASEVFGSALSAAISTYSYHPQGDRNLANLGEVWGTQLGLDSFGFMMKEFWPDIRRYLRKKKTGNGTPSGE